MSRRRRGDRRRFGVPSGRAESKMETKLAKVIEELVKMSSLAKLTPAARRGLLAALAEVRPRRSWACSFSARGDERG
jgi:hypothetical protein